MLVQANIKTILESYKSVIETELEQLLAETSNANLAQSKTLEAISYSVMNGGKRLRAILALLSTEAILKSELQIAFKNNPASGFALAIELVHCGSLIHDDLPCMDNDDLRRGKPTNHKVYGEAIALLAGDTLLCYPLEVFLTKTNNSSKANLTEISIEFIKAIKDMIAGQAMDLELSSSNKFRNIHKLQAMQELKTGALLSASVVLAAKLAGANSLQIKGLKSYSEKIGLAFQIADDILDHCSTSEELGKTAHKDVQQNKFTYVQEYSLEKAQVIAKELIEEAKAAIDDIDIYADKLKLIANYVVSRTN